MRTSPHAQPLYEQLAGAAQRTFSATEIVAHLTQTGTERSYPATLEAEIVSIAGEALANARKKMPPSDVVRVPAVTHTLAAAGEKSISARVVSAIADWVKKL